MDVELRLNTEQKELLTKINDLSASHSSIHRQAQKMSLEAEISQGSRSIIDLYHKHIALEIADGLSVATFAQFLVRKPVNVLTEELDAAVTENDLRTSNMI